MNNNHINNMSAADFLIPVSAHIGSSIIFLEEVGSTNDYAKDMGASGAPSGSVVIADKQLAGKGRLGRSWDDGEGKDIYMTILLRPEISGEAAARLTLLAGVCVAKVLNEISPKKAAIKWPNDVVMNSKKICGILTESAFIGGTIDYTVVGIGVNINRQSFPDELKDKATSLYLENDKLYSREVIIKQILNLFEKYYAEFLENGIASFIDEYRSLCVTLGKTVAIYENDVSYKAQAIGISDTGALEIVAEDGNRRIIESGEVSVRGIYGYV